jgi:hypothetical protein
MYSATTSWLMLRLASGVSLMCWRVHELADDDGLHHPLEIAFVIQQLGVLQHLFVGLLFDAIERFKQAALDLRDLA